MKSAEGISLWKRLIGRMKTDKRFEAGVYIALLAVIVSLYLLFGKAPMQKASGEKGEAGAGLERELEQALECIRGVGETHVMINNSEKDGGEVEGVIVIAEGAEDILIRGSIQSAVQTLLGVDQEKVGVYRMNEKTEVK